MLPPSYHPVHLVAYVFGVCVGIGIVALWALWIIPEALAILGGAS